MHCWRLHGDLERNCLSLYRIHVCALRRECLFLSLSECKIWKGWNKKKKKKPSKALDRVSSSIGFVSSASEPVLQSRSSIFQAGDMLPLWASVKVEKRKKWLQNLLAAWSVVIAFEFVNLFLFYYFSFFGFLNLFFYVPTLRSESNQPWARRWLNPFPVKSAH